MHISTLPPADSFADVLAWDDAPGTGLTDADLRALWVLFGDDVRLGLTDEEYRAFWAAFDHAPDEDDDGPPGAA